MRRNRRRREIWRRAGGGCRSNAGTRAASESRAKGFVGQVGRGTLWVRRVGKPMPLVFPFEGRNRISHVPISVLGQGFALGELGTVSPDCPRARTPSAAVR